jgi:ABC-2 type transport system permease protein
VASRAEIYGRVAISRVRAQAQYRVSFGLQVVGAFGISFLDFVMVVVLFRKIHSLGTWTLPEVAFLYGTSYVAFKACDLAMGNLDKLPTFIRMGQFDQILTRPLSTLGQVLTAEADLRHIGGIAQGALVLVFALQRLSVDWTAAKVLVLMTMVSSAFFIFAALWVATNAVAFWTTDAREVANAFTYGGNYMTTFPMNIFSAWMRRLFGYLIPLAFVNYFPSLYILDKPDPIGAPAFLRFCSPLAAVGAAVVAGVIWRTAVRHYRSTGS